MKKFANIFILLLCVTALSAQTTDRSIRPSAAPAKEIEIEDAVTFTMPNGIKVFVVEDHRAPIVYYSLQLDIKPALEGDKAGLQDLFAGVMGTATQTRTKEVLNKEIDLIGARIDLNARGGSGTGLKKYEPKLLELLSDMVLHPLFAQEELDLVLGQMKSGLEYLSSDASLICNRLSDALAYGKLFPDGEVATVESIERIGIEDLQEFYNTYFGPNVVRLVVVGNTTVEEARANVQKYFGNWQRKNIPVANYVIPKAPMETKVAMYSKDGAVQSAIDLCYPIEFKPGMADAEAAAIASYILGGGMSSKLFQNLRETHSYTYGVYCNLKDGELTGLFGLFDGRNGAGSVKAAATDSALVQIIYEMNNMIHQPISPDDLAAAKAFFTGTFGRSLEQSATIAQFAILIDKYNLPKDYYKNFLKRMDALTIADIQAASAKYFKPDNAWIVVVGDKSYAEDLKQFAANKEVQFYDLNANPIEAPQTKTSDLSATQIIDNYVNALGGVATLEAITDFQMTASMSMMGQNVDMTQMFMAPHYTMMSLGMGGMVLQKMVFDGVSLKVSGMQGEAEYTEGDEYEEMKANASICSEMNYVQNGFALAVNGIEEVNGKDAYVLTVTKGEKSVTEYYDVESGLKVRSSAILNVPQMGEVQQITEYSDYRPVQGMMFPFTTKQQMATMETVITVSQITVNTGLTPDDFK